MDPTQTFKEILLAIFNKDRPSAIDSLRNLADWLEKDGAIPSFRNALYDVGNRLPQMNYQSWGKD